MVLKHTLGHNISGQIHCTHVNMKTPSPISNVGVTCKNDCWYFHYFINIYAMINIGDGGRGFVHLFLSKSVFTQKVLRVTYVM